MNNGALPSNPAWNHKGPTVPLWFRRKLRALNPRLKLQFQPPRSEKEPRGVNPDMAPHGVWNICNVLPKSRRLHPIVAWSLLDIYGHPIPPSADTIHVLRTAMHLRRQGKHDEMERQVERSLNQMMENREKASHEGLVNHMRKYMSKFMGRQWENRVYLTNHGPSATMAV